MGTWPQQWDSTHMKPASWQCTPIGSGKKPIWLLPAESPAFSSPEAGAILVENDYSEASEYHEVVLVNQLAP